MGQKKPTRIAAFIDWQNLSDHRSIIDTKRLRDYINTLGVVRRCYLYLVEFGREIPQQFQRPSLYVQSLKKQGYTVRQKIILTDTHRFRDKRRRKDGNMDVDLTIDAMKTIFDPSISIDKVILFTGDWDFCPLIEEIRGCRKRNPIKVQVVGIMGSTSDKLRAAADEFIYLDEILEKVCDPDHFAHLAKERARLLGGSLLSEVQAV